MTSNFLNKVIVGDCFDVMKSIGNDSIDFILSDLPYGVSAQEWDKEMPLNLVWENFNRIIKPNRSIALTASQPFTTDLINSNRSGFCYCWYWIKNQSTNFYHAKRQPLRRVEEVVVFGSGVYNPQMSYGHKPTSSARGKSKGRVYHGENKRDEKGGKTKRYPTNVLEIKCVSNYSRDHPNQKPVDLFEYLIKSYTKAGDTVLDPFAGSCTTAIACVNTGRSYICVEKEKDYVDLFLQKANSARFN